VWFCALHTPAARAKYDRKTRTGKRACATKICLERIFSATRQGVGMLDLKLS
jgi:hypothetical protein